MNWYHIKQILRSIRKNKFNSIIKILGIIFALVPALLIWSYVKHETSYDKHFNESEKCFRVVRNWQEDLKYTSSTPVPLVTELLKTYPQITAGTRIYTLHNNEAIYNNQIFREEVMLVVDSSFFNTLGMELLSGDKNSALKNAGSVAISKKTANKLFGNKNPIGETIKFEGSSFFSTSNIATVSGVFDDFPANSHLKGNYILSIHSSRIENAASHTNHNCMTYIRLNNAESESLIEEKFPKFMELFYGKDYYDYARTTYLLQPITDIHLNTTVNSNQYETAKGNYSSLYVFPALALLIILISSFNFINLTISEGASKRKIFGINKISGAGKFYFFKIYILESLILIIISFIFVIILLNIISPLFKSFVDRELDLSFFSDPVWIGTALLIILLIGIINGIFPAYLFSQKNMISYLRDKAGSPVGKNNIQRIFQISQFAICIFFIAGSMVVYKQLNYIDSTINKSLDKENILVIKNADKLDNKRDVFKSELKKISEISDASFCDEVPGVPSYSHWGHPVDSALFDSHIVVFNGDYDYFSTLKMQITEGRFFDPEFPSDQLGIVLNETAVKTLGWEDNPIGKRYSLRQIHPVIGVVKDIHFRSFHEETIPQGFLLQPKNTGSNLLVKFNNGKSVESMKKIQKLWTQFVSNRELHTSFLNEEFEFWYKTERNTGQLAILLAGIAIFLSSLGLLALVLQSINSRIKEIGVRKVNGARTFEIVRLLNSSFVKWVAIAFVFATPVAFWSMQKWLEKFAYKTTLSWWLFIVAGLATLIIALLTVSWQSWRAASKNPVEALRYE
jgi:putative ABC transport system permease protein